jgi:hypothetical protein
MPVPLKLAPLAAPYRIGRLDLVNLIRGELGGVD